MVSIKVNLLAMSGSPAMPLGPVHFPEVRLPNDRDNQTLVGTSTAPGG
jgi:hypothetical protein